MLLKFAILEFIEDRKYNNSSEANIKNIHYALKGFSEYCIGEGVLNVEDVEDRHVKSYLMHRKNVGDKPSTLNTWLLRIRSLFNYCVESEYIRRSPATKMKRVIEDVQVAVFTDEQIEQMLGYYKRLKQRDKRLYAFRDYMLILVLLGTGLRRAEVCNLKWSDINLDRQTMQVMGKNRTSQVLPITDTLTKELAAYYLFLNRYFKDPEKTQYVFPNRYGNHLTPDASHQIFKGLREKMNFEGVRVSAHTFRHTYCNRLVSSGMNPFVIMRLMRHKNITVTQRYVNIWSEELRELNEESNPLNNFML